jgi:hypothetical protein
MFIMKICATIVEALKKKEKQSENSVHHKN